VWDVSVHRRAGGSLAPRPPPVLSGSRRLTHVSGTAIEHSLTGVSRFIVHKAKPLAGPRAETDTHYIMMGTDLDLDRAMRLAVQDVVKFLVEVKGLEPGYAYSLASVACDFRVAEAVDQTQIVTGHIPKAIFTGVPARGAVK
jgi:acetamidase/formamidase